MLKCILLILIIIIVIYLFLNRQNEEKFGELNDNNLTNDDLKIGNLLQQIKPNTEELLDTDEINKQNDSRKKIRTIYQIKLQIIQ